MRRLTSRLLAAAATATLLLAALPAVATAASPAASPAEVVVLYKHRAGPAELGRLTGRGVAFSGIELPRGDLAVVSAPTSDAATFARVLARDPGVLAAAPNGRVHAAAFPMPADDPAYAASYPNGQDRGQRNYLGPVATYPWGIDLEPAWDAAFNGTAGPSYLMPPLSRVTIAVLDTGYTRPAMDPLSLLGLDQGSDIVGVWDYAGNDADTRDENPDAHGTRVTGIIRARAGNARGIAGVLGRTQAQVRMYRVLEADGGGDEAWVAEAIMDATDDGCRVINASLATEGAADPSTVSFWNQIVDYAWSRGCIVVGASGNAYSSRVAYPAAADHALAVGSVDWLSGERTDYSNHGGALDLVAPGGEGSRGIWSETKAGSVQYGVGTSFSAPMVTGSLGLLWSLVPGLDAPEMAALATQTARHHTSDPSGFDEEYGYGHLDVWGAMQRLIADVAVEPPVAAGASVPASGGAPAVTLTWSSAGAGTTYRYGVVGGREYVTSATSARVVLSDDATHTLFVRAYTRDAWTTPDATTDVRARSGVAPLESRRFEGADRYETAAAVSSAAHGGTGGNVVLVSGQAWPDALSATVLARRLDAPLLITSTRTLSVPARDEIARLRPSHVYIVGGTGVVSETVRLDVDAIASPPTRVTTRIAGADRYETAAKVAAEVVRRSPGGALPSGNVVVASGVTFADALSAAPLAAAAGYPILLARPNGVPAATAAALRDLGATRSMVAGGTGAVSAATAAALPRPSRFGGIDRYETSRMLADLGRSSGVLSGADLGLVTGRNFPDALGGGVLLAELDSPVVLADAMTPALRAWLLATGARVERLDTFGGSGAVPLALEDDVRLGLRGF